MSLSGVAIFIGSQSYHFAKYTTLLGPERLDSFENKYQCSEAGAVVVLLHLFYFFFIFPQIKVPRHYRLTQKGIVALNST